MDDAIRLYLASQIKELKETMIQHHNITAVKDLQNVLSSYHTQNLYHFIAKTAGKCNDIVDKWAQNAAIYLKRGESQEMVPIAKELVRKMHPDKLLRQGCPPTLATRVSQFFNWIYKLLCERREQYDGWLLYRDELTPGRLDQTHTKTKHPRTAIRVRRRAEATRSNEIQTGTARA
eukprot:3689565-Rhodomonas_salina.1